METITISSKGQVVIPKQVREQLGLEEGTKLNLEVRGQEVVLSKTADWRDMQGMVTGTDLIQALEEERELDKQLENRCG
jgi:AbrB family looped-hinge helix DNA binding protein